MNGPLPAWAAFAAALDAVASWIDSELAGGSPPKWVAQTVANTLRYMAAGLRAGGEKS